MNFLRKILKKKQKSTIGDSPFSSGRIFGENLSRQQLFDPKICPPHPLIFTPVLGSKMTPVLPPFSGSKSTPFSSRIPGWNRSRFLPVFGVKVVYLRSRRPPGEKQHQTREKQPWGPRNRVPGPQNRAQAENPVFAGNTFLDLFWRFLTYCVDFRLRARISKSALYGAQPQNRGFRGFFGKIRGFSGKTRFRLCFPVAKSSNRRFRAGCGSLPTDRRLSTEIPLLTGLRTPKPGFGYIYIRNLIIDGVTYRCFWPQKRARFLGKSWMKSWMKTALFWPRFWGQNGPDFGVIFDPDFDPDFGVGTVRKRVTK